MSKKDILQTYFNGNAALTARNILIVLAFALVMAAVIFVTYRLTHSGTAYSAKLNATNVAITLITTVIMLMISSNIVISLGMVGALSIIRFRTAVKDPWDTVYIFWAVVEGLCVGSQNFKLALLSVLFIAVALILLSLRSSMIRKYLVVIRADETADPAALAEQDPVMALFAGIFPKMDALRVYRQLIKEQRPFLFLDIPDQMLT